MSEIGRWSVQVEQGRVYFMYRDHYMGQFSGSFDTAQYMVTCINAALSAYAPIADAVAQEGGYADMADWCAKDFARTGPRGEREE